MGIHMTTNLVSPMDRRGSQRSFLCIDEEAPCRRELDHILTPLQRDIIVKSELKAIAWSE